MAALVARLGLIVSTERGATSKAGLKKEGPDATARTLLHGYRKHVTWKRLVKRMQCATSQGDRGAPVRCQRGPRPGRIDKVRLREKGGPRSTNGCRCIDQTQRGRFIAKRMQFAQGWHAQDSAKLLKPFTLIVVLPMRAQNKLPNPLAMK